MTLEDLDKVLEDVIENNNLKQLRIEVFRNKEGKPTIVKYYDYK